MAEAGFFARDGTKPTQAIAALGAAPHNHGAQSLFSGTSGARGIAERDYDSPMRSSITQAY